MAKGRTNQPLVIDVDWQWRHHPAVAGLEAAGHRVRAYGHTGPSDDKPDWIMHPAAGWHEQFFAQKEDGSYPFVEARLKAERARKRVGR